MIKMSLHSYSYRVTAEIWPGLSCQAMFPSTWKAPSIYELRLPDTINTEFLQVSLVSVALSVFFMQVGRCIYCTVLFRSNSGNQRGIMIKFEQAETQCIHP